MFTHTRIFGVAMAFILCTTASAAFASTWNPTLLVNTESFQVLDEGDGTTDVQIQFGDTLSKNLSFDRINMRFAFDDDVYIAGALAATGSITLNADQTGDATLVFGSAITDQAIELLNSESIFRFSTGAILSGSLTASSATLTDLTNCDALSTNATGVVTCVGGSGAAFISVTTNANSIASDAVYDVFETASYASADFITNAAQNIVFDSANGTFTVQTDGTFLLLASVVTTVSNDNNIEYSILHNGTPVYAYERRTDNVIDPHESTVQFIYQATAGDTFELLIDGITNGRTITINNGTTLSIANVTSGGGGGGSGLAPYIADGGGRVDPSGTATLTIEGSNFDYDTVVEIPGWEGTIDAVRYNSATEIEIDVTAGATETLYDVVLKNGSKDSTGFIVNNGSGAINVAVSTWYDLRLGGDTFTDGTGAGNDIRYRAGMSLARDANGMYFTGASPWGSWVKFESLAWTRGTNQTVEWIFTNPSSAMMVGIGSDATDEASTSQWQQAEVLAYFQSSTALWGLFGNSGTPGITGNQSATTAISAGGVFKAKFEGDGDAGDTFTLYQIPSADPADWDDETTVITSFAIGGTLNPDEPNIMPFIIPVNGGTQRFIAVKVE